MKVLLSWLADFVDVPVPPDELADRLVMLGLEVASVVEVAEGPLPPGVERAASADAVIDLEITANRPDCLGLIGIAREVSAAFDVPLRLPGRGQAGALLEGERLEPGEDSALDVVLEEPGLCPRYSAAIADVQMGASPAWLARRLELSDIRPISNVVDVTNYVLMEIGQPMHAFDLSRLDGGQLRIRRARAGESITALDGVHRQLDAGMLVIADRSRPQAIAGVMGGRASEVGSSDARHRARERVLRAHLGAAHQQEAVAEDRGLGPIRARRRHRDAGPWSLSRRRAAASHRGWPGARYGDRSLSGHP